jgi:hypothetical protein
VAPRNDEINYELRLCSSPLSVWRGARGEVSPPSEEANHLTCDDHHLPKESLRMTNERNHLPKEEDHPTEEELHPTEEDDHLTEEDGHPTNEEDHPTEEGLLSTDERIFPVNDSPHAAREAAHFADDCQTRLPFCHFFAEKNPLCLRVFVANLSS